MHPRIRLYVGREEIVKLGCRTNGPDWASKHKLSARHQQQSQIERRPFATQASNVRGRGFLKGWHGSIGRLGSQTDVVDRWNTGENLATGWVAGERVLAFDPAARSTSRKADTQKNTQR